MKFQLFLLNLSIMLVCLTLAGCDPYHGFGCVAPESHPAVAHARSLTAEELETAYIEIHKLSAKYADENYETQIYKAEIPNSLQFLEAEVIRVYKNRGPYVILANCFDERIELTLSAAEDPQATVTLHWAEPTGDAPYATGDQILWQKENAK